MKKEDWKALLKKCFGKEKDEQLHAIAMLIIWGIIILILVIMIRMSPTPDDQNSTTPNDNKDSQTQVETPGIGNNNGNDESSSPTESFEVNFSYIYTVTNNGVQEVITGKKIDEKEIFTIITKEGSNSYAKLSNNYLQKENGEYHIVENPSPNLIYCDVEDISYLTEIGTLTTQGNVYTYQVPITQIVKLYNPTFDTTSIDSNLMDTITLTTENGTLKSIKANYNNYLMTVSGRISTLTIEMEFSQVGTTEDFEVTLGS
jgi:hypothetical protein